MVASNNRDYYKHDFIPKGKEGWWIMNASLTESIAAALFVYVISVVILGAVSAIFHFMADDVILIVGAVLGIGTFIVFSFKHK